MAADPKPNFPWVQPMTREERLQASLHVDEQPRQHSDDGDADVSDYDTRQPAIEDDYERR